MAVLCGILVGFFFPDFGKSLKPLGDVFIKLVKMMIAPIVFCTVVHGIASMGELKRLGRLGGLTLVYFEVVSTVALIVGLCVVNLLKPGDGFDSGAAGAMDPKLSQSYVQRAGNLSTVDFLMNIVPSTFLDAFVSGELLQVLFVSVLIALAIAGMGARGQALLGGIEYASEVFFGVMGILVRFAPVGAFGAMAFTVGSYGLAALHRLVSLMAGFYLTAFLFVVLILGSIARASGFSIFRFLAYIKDELFLVLGTSSSETALPGLIRKLERLGCRKSTVGLVVPTGYSFNLDGTNIYMSMAAIFLAQATQTPLTLAQQIHLLLIAMITSKGASGVTGAGFVALAATLAAVPSIPVQSLALLVGIDRFMSECRALTNLIGNGVATLVLSRWEGEVSREDLSAKLNAKAPPGSE